MPEPFISTGMIVTSYSVVLALSRPRSAVSDEAKSVLKVASSVVELVERSRALFGRKASLISTLSALGVESREANWDGYGAHPVNQCALERARDLIASIPDDHTLPECSIEPDGCVALEWIPASHRILTISVCADDRLPYAWVDGTDRGHGVARLVDGELPPRILNEIRRFGIHESPVRAA